MNMRGTRPVNPHPPPRRWRVFKALWRMSSVNMRPALKVGDVVPSSRCVALSLHEGKLGPPVDLASPTLSTDRPLVLNFGSCS